MNLDSVWRSWWALFKTNIVNKGEPMTVYGAYVWFDKFNYGSSVAWVRMGTWRLFLGSLYICCFRLIDGAALRQERTTTARESGHATMDLVVVHCKESYDLEEGGDGSSSGFSPVVWDAGSHQSFLRLRRRFIYTKCAHRLRVGPAFTIVNI